MRSYLIQRGVCIKTLLIYFVPSFFSRANDFKLIIFSHTIYHIPGKYVNCICVFNHLKTYKVVWNCSIMWSNCNVFVTKVNNQIFTSLCFCDSLGALTSELFPENYLQHVYLEVVSISFLRYEFCTVPLLKCWLVVKLTSFQLTI